MADFRKKAEILEEKLVKMKRREDQQFRNFRGSTISPPNQRGVDCQNKTPIPLALQTMQGINQIKLKNHEIGEITQVEYATLSAAKKVLVYSTSLGIICTQNKLSFMALHFLLKAVSQMHVC